MGVIMLGCCLVILLPVVRSEWSGVSGQEIFSEVTYVSQVYEVMSQVSGAFVAG
jgi:hypothetical protein